MKIIEFPDLIREHARTLARLRTSRRDLHAAEEKVHELECFVIEQDNVAKSQISNGMNRTHLIQRHLERIEQETDDWERDENQNE